MARHPNKLCLHFLGVLVVGHLLNFTVVIVVKLDEVVKVVFFCELLKVERSLERFSKVIQFMHVMQKPLKKQKFFIRFIILERDYWNSV